MIPDANHYRPNVDPDDMPVWGTCRRCGDVYLTTGFVWYCGDHFCGTCKYQIERGH